MTDSADLAPLLVPQPAAGVTYKLGKIISWDRSTFENTIQYDGGRLHDLDVMGGTDPLTWGEGQLVSLRSIDASGSEGVTQWIIEGRIIRPGSGNAEEIISFLRGQLARQIAAEIFAEQIHFDEDSGVAIRSGSTFGDPDTLGDPGPLLTDVPISAVGKAVVIFSADANSDTGNDPGSSDPNKAGKLSVAISGATEQSASDIYAARMDVRRLILSTDVRINVDATPTRIAVFDDLNEGLHDFKIEYRNDGDTEFVTSNRTLMVIGI